MSMAIVDLGYRKIVLPVEKACELAQILIDMEIYEYKYHRDDATDTSTKTNHIWKPTDGMVDIQIITDATYNKFKLAGEPKKA